MDIGGSNHDQKPIRYIKVDMSASKTLTRLGTEELKNPIEIRQVGPSILIYTKTPLTDIIEDGQTAIVGPVSTEGEERSVYKVDLRFPFIAQLEEDIELISNGKGLFELQRNPNEKTILLDAQEALKFLLKAGAYDKKTNPDRDSESILDMHKKIQAKKEKS